MIICNFAIALQLFITKNPVRILSPQIPFEQVLNNHLLTTSTSAVSVAVKVLFFL
jgi:hypothetical protein